jgi:hypothetical protein
MDLIPSCGKDDMFQTLRPNVISLGLCRETIALKITPVFGT